MNWRKKGVWVFICICITTVSAEAQQTDNFDLDQVYPISSNGTIQLQSTDAYVEIIGSDREDVHVRVRYRNKIKGISIGKADEFQMQVTSHEDGNLIIKEQSRDSGGINVNLGYIDTDYSILIEAPRHVNLNIEGDDDAYEISGIDGSIRMNTDDSDTIVKNYNGELLRSDYDDGEFVMIGGRGELWLNYDDGKSDIRDGNFDWINITSDDGSITVATRLTEDGDYTITSDDGPVNINILKGGGEFMINHEGNPVVASHSFREIQQNGTYAEYFLPEGNSRVRIETTEGDVRMQAP